MNVSAFRNYIALTKKLHQSLIYILCEPEDRVGSTGRLYTAGEIRYVGKSTQGMARPKEHTYFEKFKDSQCRNDNWLKSLHKGGHKVGIEILESGFETHQELLDAEVFYIAYFRSLGFDLTNQTDGGEGLPGYTHTPESRLKMSQKLKGKPKSAEQRRKLSIAKTGIPTGHRAPEVSAKIAKTRRELQSGARRVLDSDGNEYLSVNYAAAAFGLASVTVISSIKSGIPVKKIGKFFSYVDGLPPRKVIQRDVGIGAKAILGSNGVTYPSIKVAEKETGISKHQIRACLAGKKTRWPLEVTFQYYQP